MATTYNPYSDIQSVYNAKVAWNNATTDEERKRQQSIADAARKNLVAYGYGDVAEQISASGADATAARKILEKYAPQTTAPDSTNLSTSELITKNNNEVNNKINSAWGTVQSDKDKYYSEYDKVSDYVNQDVTQTDEYKSAFKNIMPEYNMKAMQGRDNAVASGGASNGGNIDSYSAANAMRQQAALIAKGQATAHQIGLDTYNARVGNARNILSDLGVYQKDSWNAMGNLIDQQQTEGQRLFENDLAEKTTMAEVTGYVPTEWTYANNIYLNSDGTVRDEYLTDEFDNTGGFTTIINNAKAKLATTTDATERANLQATINAATQAKALKTYSSPKYSKYAHEVQNVTNPITEARRQSEQDNATVLKTLDINSTDTRYGIDANNKNALDQINANTQGQKEIIAETSKYGNVQIDKNGKVIATGDSGDNEWDIFTGSFSDDDVLTFLKEKLKPYYDGGIEINEEVLEKLIVGSDVTNSNSTAYDIDVEDAKAICDALGLDSSWLSKYKNRWGANSGKGMKLAE